MNLTVFRLRILIQSTLLLVFWALSIDKNWVFFQNMRFTDPLWLIGNIYPWLYSVIFSYVLLFAIIFENGLENKLFNIIFLIIYCIIVYLVPYAVSSYYRFPDTYYVINNSFFIDAIISKKVHVVYPQSYPSSYMLFNLVNHITKIDLFLFSRLIWSPLIIIGTIFLWYIFVEKFFGPKSAILTCMLAVPAQIVEITTSPNSLGIGLLLTFLVLCTFKGKSSRILLLITLLACLSAHSISYLILLLFLNIFYIFSFLPDAYIKVSFNLLFLATVLWFVWNSLTEMGPGILNAICNTYMFKSKSVEHLATYTVSSGNLTYPWIQKYNNYKYELYAVLTSLIFIFDTHNIYKYKINVFFNKFYSRRLMFLVIALILLSLTVINLTFGGSDTENIISRTLNFSMLAISAYIGSFWAISSEFFPVSSKKNTIGPEGKKAQKKHGNALPADYDMECMVSDVPGFSAQKRKLLFGIIILFLLVVSTTYPVYSYARDSYINYPLSERYGDIFFQKHESESFLNKTSRSLYFHDLMKNQAPLVEASKPQNNFVIYDDGWCLVSTSGGRYVQ